VLYVRTQPRFVEQRLLRAVEAEDGSRSNDPIPCRLAVDSMCPTRVLKADCRSWKTTGLSALWLDFGTFRRVLLDCLLGVFGLSQKIQKTWKCVLTV
jgi:hypothetical protein